ncbi:ABC transporter substrate-binding protein [Allofournierella sp.]|uniref:ABC transporter substrate-binding protein n=1 Tax=Allofournierella sp. TaxID=1940256 RepID=UPI003AB911FA
MKKIVELCKRGICAALCAAFLAGCAAAPGESPSSRAPVASGAEDAVSQAAYEKPDAGRTAVLKLSCAANEAEKQLIEEAIGRFNEKYPNVKVETTFSVGDSWQDYSSKLVVQMASGNAPDVVGVAIEGTRMMVGKEVLIPLNDYLQNDPDGEEMLQDITKTAWDAFTVEGSIYEVPKDSNIVVMFYNKKMFADAGIPEPDPDWTWDDFVSIAQKLTTGEGESKVWGYMVRDNITTGYLPFLTTNGTNLLNPELTASNLNDPKVQESFQFIYDLVHKYRVAPVPEAKTDIINLFAAGRVAMIPTGMFAIPTFKENGFTDYAIAPLPKKESHSASFGVGGLGIVNSCKEKDLAWELVKELSSKEFAMRCAEEQTTLPVRRSAAESEAFTKVMPNAQLFYEELENASAFPCPYIYPDMSRIVISMPPG